MVFHMNQTNDELFRGTLISFRARNVRKESVLERFYFLKSIPGRRLSLWLQLTCSEISISLKFVIELRY